MWWKSLRECLKSWIVNKKLQLLKIIMNWIVVDQVYRSFFILIIVTLLLVLFYLVVTIGSVYWLAYVERISCIFFVFLVVFEVQMNVEFCASKVSVLWLQFYFFRNGVKICKLLYMPQNILVGESTSSLVADLVMCLSTLVYWYGLRDFWLHNYRCTMILLINSRIRIQTQFIRYLAKCFGQFNT